MNIQYTATIGNLGWSGKSNTTSALSLKSKWGICFYFAHLYTVQQSLSLLLPGSSLDQRHRVLNCLHSTPEQTPSPTHSSTIRSVCVWEKRSESFSNRSWVGEGRKEERKKDTKWNPLIWKNAPPQTHVWFLSIYCVHSLPFWCLRSKEHCWGFLLL